MASKEVVEDFRGNDTSPFPDIYDDLTGSSSGPHVGSPNPQNWQELNQSFANASGSFRCAATGTLLAPPPVGQARYAKLPFNSLSHTAGVTTFEVRLVPGMAFTGKLDSGFEQFGIDVSLTGSGTVGWNFSPIATFTGATPGALVTLRVEITNTQVRFYVDDVLKHTKSGGVSYGATVDEIQLEMPGYYTAHGRPEGVLALALDALKIKTETTSGTLLPPSEPPQPEATDDPDFRVLFSDTFQTLRSLHASHGETGPLGMNEWTGLATLDHPTDYVEVLNSGNWTRSDTGLLVEAVVRSPYPENGVVARVDFSGAEATTGLPCVLECRLFGHATLSLGFEPSDGTYVSAESVVTLDLKYDGSIETYIGPDNSVSDYYPFAVPPAGAEGALVRLEVWSDHVRTYANGALIGFIPHDMAGLLNKPGGACVVDRAIIRRNAYVDILGVAVPVEISPFGEAARVSNLFKVSGVQDSSGPLPEIPPNEEDGTPQPVVGPNNEPPAQAGGSFWTNFNATYEVP